VRDFDEVPASVVAESTRISRSSSDETTRLRVDLRFNATSGADGNVSVW
jgi:hypothetical protein